MNTSLGTVREMLYYYIERSDRSSVTPAEAHNDMKWFRSNIRRGSRLALFALAVQFLLSFGHFHASSAQAAPAVATQSALHEAASGAVTLALKRTLRADASRAAPLKTSSDHAPDGRLTDECAICAVLALAGAMTIVTPPYLLGPQAVAFSHLITDTAPVDLNSAGVAFQPRAPPVC
jgi:hypothetical protein